MRTDRHYEFGARQFTIKWMNSISCVRAQREGALDGIIPTIDNGMPDGVFNEPTVSVLLGLQRRQEERAALQFAKSLGLV
jgi:hypothetical protein